MSGAASPPGTSLICPYDEGVELYYLRARYYDPSTAQFTSRDPAVASTRQPYSYSYDNPLNLTDPSGLDPCSMLGSLACPFNVGGVVSRLQNMANQAYQHLTAGIGECFGGCAQVQAQGGRLTLSAGAIGYTGRGPYIGYANKPVSQRGDYNAFGILGYGAVGSVSRGTCDPADWEADAMYGVGGAAGIMSDRIPKTALTPGAGPFSYQVGPEDIGWYQLPQPYTDVLH